MDETSLASGHEMGIARINIFSLSFPPKIETGRRECDPGIVKYLANVFKSSRNGCDRDEPDHHIKAEVSLTDLDSILQRSSFTRNDFQKTIASGKYPTLKVVHENVMCLYGQHRLETLKQAALKHPNRDDCWWTIKLLSFEVGCK
jgi:hypothetical protein